MNHVTLIFLGLLVTFVGSWTGMVVAPQIQLGRQVFEDICSRLPGKIGAKAIKAGLKTIPIFESRDDDTGAQRHA